MAFIRTLTGSTASGFATWGFIFLLGLTIISGELTATQLGLALGARTIGFLFGVLFGGIIADKFPRRNVIFVSSIISALGILAVMIGINSDIELAYVGAVLAGIGQGGCRPAYQAYVPMVVSTENLQSANAAMGLSVRLVTLLGPSLTSAIVLYFGSMPAYILLLVMWTISALAPPKIEEKSIVKTVKSTSSVINDFAEGLSEAKKHPWFLGSLAALTLVIAFGYSSTNVILPMVSQNSGSIGLIAKCITAYTFGGILGAIFISKYKPKHAGWVALAGMASYGLAPLGLLFYDTFGIAVFGYIIGGFGIEVFNVIWFTAIQREVPKTHLARVSSLDFLCSYGLAPLGLGLIAPFAEKAGLNNVLLVCGLITLLAPLIVIKIVPSSRQYSIGAINQ